jgi:hypothetical protein
MMMAFPVLASMGLGGSILGAVYAVGNYVYDWVRSHLWVTV